MKYAKLIDGSIRYAQKTETFSDAIRYEKEVIKEVEKDGEIVGETVMEEVEEVLLMDYDNPSGELLLRMGFKPVIVTEQQKYKKFFYTVPYFTETDTEIVQHWTHEKLPEPDRKTLIVSKIAERYDFNDEIALLKKSSDDPDRVAYDSYVEECKSWAAAEIEEYNNA